MRRLFWTFPDGLPGIGLLLLRLALCGAVLHGVVARSETIASGGSMALAFAECIVAAGLLAGFCTPFWAVGTATVELWRAASDPAAFLLHCLMASNGASLALLGPGAASVDARLFGWRRVDLGGPRR